ncbi:uncharacterized protein LOC143281670 [Babylonia areolata]|uniref:uncharacterized protein LOC143281670 n=1 Tax=Babylonia areolata TaxID=304850 RepID=UPI003FCF79E6
MQPLAVCSALCRAGDVRVPVRIFDRATRGSPKVHCFMIDLIVPSRQFPKIKDLVGYRPVMHSNCLYLMGGKDCMEPWQLHGGRLEIRPHDSTNGRKPNRSNSPGASLLWRRWMESFMSWTERRNITR